MKVLILGGTGMLGHKLTQLLPAPIEAVATVRGEASSVRRYGFFCPDQVLGGVEATDLASVARAVESIGPQAVVNCIGIVKQSALAKDPVPSIAVNALFPHQLHALCHERGARLVHVSTDCVFSGSRGGYTEGDACDATDLYGRSKAMGEVWEGAVTLRTSIIGRELSSSHGLVEWFLANRGGKVKGYANAVFSGVTTTELSRVVARVLLEHKDLEGVWHVASRPISKDSLLRLLNGSYGAGVEVEQDGSIATDRSLDGSALCEKTGYVAPEWPEMVAEMAADPTPYDKWKRP